MFVMKLFYRLKQIYVFPFVLIFLLLGVNSISGERVMNLISFCKTKVVGVQFG